jgi:phenylacetate-CoA ligase
VNARDRVLLSPEPRDPEQPFWDPPIQTMDPQRRRELQDARVRELAARILEGPVPFFRRKLTQAGIEDAGDVTGVATLASIPVTRKQELRDSESEHPPVGDYRFTGVDECIRIGTSTGTTGIPTIRLWTRHDLWVEYESAARHWWRNGWRPGQIVTHAHPGYLYGGGLLLQGTYEYFGFLPIWVPPPDTDDSAAEGIRMWQRLPPDIPFHHYSVARFHEVATKLGLDPRADLSLPEPYYKGAVADAPLTSGGSECYAFVASPCGVQPGGHVNEDWAVLEATDPASGRPVPHGQWGSLTITTLDRDNGLLRYDLEEAVRILDDRCACGETTIRAVWGGRIAHLVDCQGLRFQVAEIEEALRTVTAVCTPTLEFQVVRPSRADAALVVRVEGDDDAAEACTTAIRDRLGIVAAPEMTPRGALPRVAYKAVRLVDA